jgi:hypothetical protein
VGAAGAVVPGGATTAFGAGVFGSIKTGSCGTSGSLFLAIVSADAVEVNHCEPTTNPAANSRTLITTQPAVMDIRELLFKENS